MKEKEKKNYNALMRVFKEIETYVATEFPDGSMSDGLVFKDETDFLRNDDPDYFFNSVALPTTTTTKGRVILWSTPRGTDSYFKRIIQPDLDQPADGFYEDVIMKWK